MGIFTNLRTANSRLWEEAVTHPFVQEMGAGTLPLAKFQRYFVQDYVFLTDLVTAVALAVAKAPDMEAARNLTAFLHDVLQHEEALFQNAFSGWGLMPGERDQVERGHVTQAFGDFMVRTAYAGGFPEVLTLLAVTEGVYLDWATRLVEAGADPDTQIYKDWTAIHSTLDFTAFVHWLHARMDALAVEPGARARLSEVFRRALEYEIAFWEQAYEG